MRWFGVNPVGPSFRSVTVLTLFAVLSIAVRSSEPQASACAEMRSGFDQAVAAVMPRVVKAERSTTGQPPGMRNGPSRSGRLSRSMIGVMNIMM